MNTNGEGVGVAPDVNYPRAPFLRNDSARQVHPTGYEAAKDQVSSSMESRGRVRVKR